MSAIGAAAPLATVRRPAIDPGRPFVSPAFDYLVIGGGLSILVLGALQSGALPSLARVLEKNQWLIVFIANSAHFAASTVRLYTRPGSFRDFRFLTLGLPFLALAVLGAALTVPNLVGRHLVSLYLTWSPYHYAAQAYGIAILYCHRSAPGWSATDRRLLRLACVLPFLYTFFALPGVGFSWLMPQAVLSLPAVGAVQEALVNVLRIACFAAPAFIFFRHQTGGRAPLPLISLLAVLSNAIWLVPFSYQAPLVMITVTVFHGLQYLAIVMIVHVKERTKGASGAAAGWRPAASFYAWCLVLAYGLFHLWPRAYVLAGFSYAQSYLLIVSVINVHHFIVDAYIWRLRRDPSYAAAAAVGPAPAATAIAPS
jgi:hypothetical protein